IAPDTHADIRTRFIARSLSLLIAFGWRLIAVSGAGSTSAASTACTRAAAAATTASTRAALLNATAFPLDPLREIIGERLVFSAFRAQRLKHREVPLMTIIGKQHAAFERRQRQSNRVRLSICDRIVDGDLVLDDVVGDALE